ILSLQHKPGSRPFTWDGSARLSTSSHSPQRREIMTRTSEACWIRLRWWSPAIRALAAFRSRKELAGCGRISKWLSNDCRIAGKCTANPGQLLEERFKVTLVL